MVLGVIAASDHRKPGMVPLMSWCNNMQNRTCTHPVACTFSRGLTHELRPRGYGQAP